ncbi:MULTISPECIES: YraN family protein [unclassified Neptuniibacter]|jgi:putative endonuclease|uniref:YraN family protein n=1 Tax=unclassified Neptuniibacter TaxID=2630693 RepID=UPI0026E1FB1F|nr:MULTISPECIES: YraN family protein [unclassified Neptuniibacter]MDO6512856.1 YraN family protein [Neptuniibacter sp. 2_MG-2023]MDO6592960.1 YraN family protein [Neptuniibacter sp. 1_MG-2023]
MDRNKTGKDAEKQAEKFLQTQRLKLLNRNFSCRFGEIDLIMQDGQTIVFIEVRYRNTKRYGGAAASVTPTKQAKIIKAAQLYLSQQPRLANKNCRFDVIAFEYDAAPSHPLWYKDAFRI